MKKTLSHSTEDYLKAIYALNMDGNPASTNDLAERLEIAPASVTGMLQRLAATTPFVDYRKRQGVTLTPDGEKAALKVIRRHRLLETYLYESLGFTWDEVHAEACELEHVISDHFEKRIDEILGHPTRDPHGDPIPDLGLAMPKEADIRLSTLRPPQKAIIQRVDAEDGNLLRYLDEKSLLPGTKLETRAFSPIDGNLTIAVDGKEMVLGRAVTRHIFIKIL